MQIIGSRTGSSFRASSDYYSMKRQFTPGVDPTTGGPVHVVDDYTDDPVPYRVDTDPRSDTYRQVIPAPKPKKKPTTIIVEEED